MIIFLSASEHFSKIYEEKPFAFEKTFFLKSELSSLLFGILLVRALTVLPSTTLYFKQAIYSPGKH